MNTITNIPVPNRKQSQGDITQNGISLDTEWIQIDAECSATPTAGKLSILFLTPGMSALKPFKDSNGNALEIDLTAPYPVMIQNVAVGTIVVRPTGFDADKFFSAAITYKSGGAK